MNDLVKNDGSIEEFENRGDNLITGNRQMAQVQAQVVMAKRFPRDEETALLKMKKAVQRKKLAENALYAYPRGGTMVEGPSIRLAETIARHWGNLEFGIEEVEQKDGYSVAQAYAWDLETNTRQVKTFKVKLERHSKRGVTKLVDPRDIYEHVANYGARRVRACILGVIPQDIVDDVVEASQKALASSDVPIADRIKALLEAFDQIGVSKEKIEERLGHELKAVVPRQILDLRKIYTSVKDGMSKREDWFDFPKNVASEASKNLNDALTATTESEDSGIKSEGDAKSL